METFILLVKEVLKGNNQSGKSKMQGKLDEDKCDNLMKIKLIDSEDQNFLKEITKENNVYTDEIKDTMEVLQEGDRIKIGDEEFLEVNDIVPASFQTTQEKENATEIEEKDKKEDELQ
jgi:hypothetical protein